MRWQSWTKTSDKEVAGQFCSRTFLWIRITPSWCQWEKTRSFHLFLCAPFLFLSHFWLACSRKTVRNSCSYMLRLFDFGSWRWFYWRWKSTHEQRIKQAELEKEEGVKGTGAEHLPTYSQFLLKPVTQISLTSNGCFQWACQRHGAGEGQAEFSQKYSACIGLSDLDL